jgi:translation initiation factor 2 beta subunit (eIF-2beta)/eIF-5
MDSFEEQLNKLYSKLESTKKYDKIEFPIPKLIKSGHKTIWANFNEYINIFNHEHNIFINFINNETKNKVSLISENINNGCIFQDKIDQASIYELSKKYYYKYIICKNCKNNNTNVFKNTNLREYQLTCIDCNSNYTI